MKLDLLRRSLACAALCVVVASCGGGGGSGSALPISPTGSSGAGPGPSPTEPDTGARVLSGTAATGAAFDAASVSVQDQTGATVCTTQTDAQGFYQCTLPAATKAPLTIAAQRDEQSFYSATAGAGGTANITPLTTLIVSRLAPDGQPAHFAAAVQADGSLASDERLQQQVDGLTAALQPVLAALGQERLDPISGSFKADGTGHDRLLDALSVSVRPEADAANIEITVKVRKSAPEEAPVSVIFRSNDASIPRLPAGIKPEQLRGIPGPDELAALLARLNACYRLPLSQRVNAPGDAVAVTGGPSDVIAPACRELFIGNDPANYLDNGLGVGRTMGTTTAFPGLFRRESTGLAFDRASFEFFRANGDLTFSYRGTDVEGNVAFATLTARRIGGALKLVGDGHVYESGVRPRFTYRDMINSPAFSAYTTGYTVFIRNRLAGGVPVFSKVIVTSPLNGDVLTLVPQPGLTFLVTAKADGTPVLNNGITLRGVYANPETRGRLATREPNLGLLDPEYPDAQISRLQDQGVWKFEFVHAQAGVPNVVQYQPTLSRALTIGELRQQPLFDLTPAMRAHLVARTNASAGLVFPENSTAQPNILDISAPGDQDAWAVPPGARPPATLNAFGFSAAGVSFNDGVALPPAARKGIVQCSAETAGDTHCDANASQQFAKGTRLHFISLETSGTRTPGFTRFVLFYKQF
jgi:hypothetical protein